MLKQGLQQKLLQKLSPQQIQVIKLLEVPAMQLEQRIKAEMEENPALEEGEEEIVDIQEDEFDDDINEKDSDDEEFSLEDYLNEEDDTPSYKTKSDNYSADDDRKEIPFSVGKTFHEFLENQVELLFLKEKQQVLAIYVIGNIDEDGYLRREIEAMVDDIAFSQNIETNEQELLEVLKIIHELDPPGIGARDLRECLLLQIKRKKLTDPAVKLAYDIINEYFEEFTKKHYDKIIKRTNSTEELLKNAITEILRLNPKPGSSFSDPLNKAVQNIIPDFILDDTDGELSVSLTSKNLPELRVSKSYDAMLREYSSSNNKITEKQKETINFVKQKIDSARWFIDAIKQRHETLLNTMNTILQYQYEYFIDGDETKLKPMILKDIADVVGLDISTISRVSNSKYIQTHFGIIPLKYFFSEAMQTTDGEDVSSREIKKILQDCIEAEDKRKPLTDDKLAQLLNEKGYQIARRTVAKYREQLNIPVGRLRVVI